MAEAFSPVESKNALRARLAVYFGVLFLFPAPIQAGPIFEDLFGDTIGAPNIAHDIKSISTEVSQSAITFAIDFYGTIAPPSTFSLNSVVGFIDVDIDQNSSTGVSSHRTRFGEGDSNLGVEFFLDLFSERFHAGMVEIIDANTAREIGLAQAIYEPRRFSVAVPLELLSNDGIVNYGAMVGDFLDMSDIAPNMGVAFSVPEPGGGALLIAGISLLLTGLARVYRGGRRISR